ARPARRPDRHRGAGDRAEGAGPGAGRPHLRPPGPGGGRPVQEAPDRQAEGAGSMTRPQNLVFLGLSLSSSWGNGHATTYRALLRGLAEKGHDITFLERDVPWYRDNRDLREPDWCRLDYYSGVEDLLLRHRRTLA